MPRRARNGRSFNYLLRRVPQDEKNDEKDDELSEELAEDEEDEDEDEEVEVPLGPPNVLPLLPAPPGQLIEPSLLPNPSEWPNVLPPLPAISNGRPDSSSIPGQPSSTPLAQSSLVIQSSFVSPSVPSSSQSAPTSLSSAVNSPPPQPDKSTSFISMTLSFSSSTTKSEQIKLETDIESLQTHSIVYQSPQYRTDVSTILITSTKNRSESTSSVRSESDSLSAPYTSSINEATVQATKVAQSTQVPLISPTAKGLLIGLGTLAADDGRATPDQYELPRDAFPSPRTERCVQILKIRVSISMPFNGDDNSTITCCGPQITRNEKLWHDEYISLGLSDCRLNPTEQQRAELSL
ncbi:hypothetical protein CC78DRAFT_586202 [Lojkania enalia]|uniref:Uncharacterized protein n=1 Tax=Lojkania enalia TaxID=147567 RepID=A0A9P4MVN7_9PLEO|nr:hypothetical protein CC78DRAFT_586202 [Didymosphaeria enalia]